MRRRRPCGGCAGWVGRRARVGGGGGEVFRLGDWGVLRGVVVLGFGVDGGVVWCLGWEGWWGWEFDGYCGWLIFLGKTRLGVGKLYDIGEIACSHNHEHDFPIY